MNTPASSIRPGQPWLDTQGKRIQAHGGSVMYLDGTYYWYGENKEKTDGKNGIWHWGVRCYASTDLYNWEDKGLIIPPEPEDPNSSLHPSASMDRPHILYNQRTKKFVCWLKIMNRDKTQTETVLTADHILGPYTKVREGLRPLGMSAGDFDLAVAPDGKAYYYFERVHSETICADLTDDYADITREMGAVAAHFGRQVLRDVPEADFRAAIPELRRECGDRAVLRALHFYADDRKALDEADALEARDFNRFLALVNASGLSSALHLQNTWSVADPRQQAIPLALAIGRELLEGTGAIRVHGGGFAGTIQAFVPEEKLASFQTGMEKLLGAGRCHILHIRPQGGCVVLD